ncbi:MAG: ATP-binding protein [Bacilli bacterium]|nr:ATP-binding protein [Bacilli bacterium]
MERYFLRTVDKQLKKWATSKEKTIALINGARRTGKTYALQYLGEQEFEKHEIIQVDRLNDTEISLLMDKNRRVDNFCDFLLSNYDISRESINDRLLIVFDEIQEHSELKESISVFNSELGCRFACTGSALWINDTNGTRPTADYESFNVYPFSFEEFLGIIGESNRLIEVDTTLLNRKDKDGEKELLKLLRLYISIGGMPQPIGCYLDYKEDKNVFAEINKCKRVSIVSLYENDLARYKDKFNLNLPLEYRNIIMTIGKPRDISNLKDIYEKLVKMNVIIASCNLLNVNSKLSSFFDDNCVKPFLLDTGVLFYYLCGNERDDLVQAFYENFINGKDSDDNGYLYENFVASSLVQHSAIPFFKKFTDLDGNGKEKTYELDFVYSQEEGPTVLEAKSGVDKEHKSLMIGLRKYQKVKQSYILCKFYKFDKQNIQRGPHYVTFYALPFLLR